MYDIERMRRLQAGSYVAGVTRAYSDLGVQALNGMLDLVIRVYRRLDPGSRSQPLAFFVCMEPSPMALPAPKHKILDPDLLDYELDGPSLAQVVGGQTLHVYDLSDLDLSELSKTGIVYHYDQGLERVLVKGEEFQLHNPLSGSPSVFCRPTFTSLVQALNRYRATSALNSSCRILKAVWVDEKQRWYFRAKPEKTMRMSLTQYLENVLQDAEVRAEQPVDESHPVDIKVSWMSSGLRAIIEIKWLGDSVDDDGKPTTAYRDARANDGADQLAKYLDSSREFGSNVITRGYLVVYDARRRGLSPAMTSLSRAEGHHYRDMEIEYHPDFSVQRTDFQTPLRFFMNPICS